MNSPFCLQAQQACLTILSRSVSDFLILLDTDTFLNSNAISSPSVVFTAFRSDDIFCRLPVNLIKVFLHDDTLH